MQRIVVKENKDIFDYVVDFAIKQHNQPEESYRNRPDLWNIANRHYEIKFHGANGRVYRLFKAKFNCEPDKVYTQILKWRKGNDEIEMSVTYYCQKYNHVKKKRRYLFVHWITVNGEQVFKCRPCWPAEPEKDSWRYWFEY